ncbi:MAG: hypothetical protein ACOYL3_26230 [Desulfuromonadaceae bacterium]
MTENNVTHNIKLLDHINSACIEILNALSDTFENTTNDQYKEDINKDMVTLENLKHIVSAVKKDIESKTVGASTELLLRIAANDFNNKLALIPEKKTLRNEITDSLIEVHSNLLHHHRVKERHRDEY